MEYYLDLTAVQFVLCCLFCMYFLQKVTMKRLRWWTYLFFALYSLLQFALIYLAYGYLFLYLGIGLLLFFAFFRRKALSYGILYLTAKTGLSVLVFLMFPDISLYRGILIAQGSGALLALLLYPVCFLALYAVTLFVDKAFRLSSFKEQVLLQLGEKQFLINAYFDTGNLLKKDNVPVVFMHRDNFPLGREEFTIPVALKTLGGSECFMACPALIQILPRREYQYVYLCLVGGEKDFNGCEMLLNAYLF